MSHLKVPREETESSHLSTDLVACLVVQAHINSHEACGGCNTKAGAPPIYDNVCGTKHAAANACGRKVSNREPSPCDQSRKHRQRHHHFAYPHTGLCVPPPPIHVTAGRRYWSSIPIECMVAVRAPHAVAPSVSIDDDAAVGAAAKGVLAMGFDVLTEKACLFFSAIPLTRELLVARIFRQSSTARRSEKLVIMRQLAATDWARDGIGALHLLRRPPLNARCTEGVA